MVKGVSSHSVRGWANQLTLCVPADNYHVPTESSIYCAGTWTGKQEMSSWLRRVIRGLKACNSAETILLLLESIFPLVNHLFVYLFLIPGTIETELYNNLTKLSLNHSGL